MIQVYRDEKVVVGTTDLHCSNQLIFIEGAVKKTIVKLTMRCHFCKIVQVHLKVSGGQQHSLHIILDHQQITNMLIAFPLIQLHALYIENPLDPSSFVSTMHKKIQIVSIENMSFRVNLVPATVNILYPLIKVLGWDFLTFARCVIPLKPSFILASWSDTDDGDELFKSSVSIVLLLKKLCEKLYVGETH